MRLTVPALPGLVTAALTAVATSGAGGAVIPGGTVPNCKPKANITAIIDNSGSMSDVGHDPGNLRKQGANQLISTPGNEQKTIRVIRFGSDPEEIVAREPMGPNRSAISTILDQKLNSDSGATNYNATFALAKANPGDAFIFLTDGEPTSGGPYSEAHRGGPPTYSVGLGPDIVGKADAEGLLKRISAETGGRYFQASTPDDIQDVFSQINDLLNCKFPGRAIRDTFNRVGQEKQHSLSLGTGVRSATLTSSWSVAGARFAIRRVLLLGRRGKVVGKVSRRRVRRLRLTQRAGATFLTAKISGLRRGKLRFRVQAQALGASGGKPVRVTTRVTPSRSR